MTFDNDDVKGALSRKSDSVAVKAGAPSYYSEGREATESTAKHATQSVSLITIELVADGTTWLDAVMDLAMRTETEAVSSAATWGVYHDLQQK